ncbi:hypothetical protein [Streptomyces sp. NPDC005423]|uniref:hypothetical protein n=1 Tax=Streptomyces sp. NPDC005423 TaxID=3155343 RepID=UPI0033A21DA4
MLVLLEVRRSAKGHLEGTVKAGPQDPGDPFHGVVGLVSALESRLDEAGSPEPEPPCDRTPYPFPGRFSGGPGEEPGGGP